MKANDYSPDDLPELEQTEFWSGVWSGRRIEDANDGGDMGDSISISLDDLGEFSSAEL